MEELDFGWRGGRAWIDDEFDVDANVIVMFDEALDLFCFEVFGDDQQ